MAIEQSTDFGYLLRSARREAGLTQEALAERAGISARAVSDLERGINRVPRRDTLDMLAQALDLTDEERKQWDRARQHLSLRSETDGSRDDGERAVHLPASLTSFVGRELEVASVVKMLRRPETRLLTLTGPGGVGKTRLSLAVADKITAEFPGGIWFVSLASLNDHELVLPTVASTLGLIRTGDRPVLEILTEALASSRSLLILDNVEHVIASALQIGALVRACPHIAILATSRIPLRVQGETEYDVPPLGLPDTGEDAETFALLQSEAVTLFAQRAQSIRPDFKVSGDNARAIAGICQRLDGIPLAIELAAAHIRLLSPQSMMRRLEHSLPLLTGGAIDLPLRHQTLRNTIAWSYDLLSPDSRHTFQHLSVFRGGWTLESAAAVIGEDVVAQLERLVEHSLVRAREQPDGEPRYSMLETIREFGLEQLAQSLRAEEAHAQHGHYFLKLAEDAVPFWRTHEHTRHYGQLETELDNLRAALAWFIEHDGETACRFSGALWRFCVAHGNVGEGRRWLETSLAQYPDLPPAVRARVLEGIGTCAYLMSDYAVMRTCFEEVLPLWEEVGDVNGLVWAHHALGRLTYETGDFSLAESHCNASLAVARQAGNFSGIAEALNVLGVVASASGEDDRARLLYEESLELRREVGDQFGVQQSLSNLGLIAMRAGDLLQARRMFEESLAIGRKHHIERVVEAQELRHLGMLAVLEGAYQRARALLSESVKKFRYQGTAFWMSRCLMWFAVLAVREQQPARAATIIGAIEATVEQRKIHVAPFDGVEYDAAVADARHRLGEDAWFAAWAVGRTMSIDEAVEYALGEDIPGG